MVRAAGSSDAETDAVATEGVGADRRAFDARGVPGGTLPRVSTRLSAALSIGPGTRIGVAGRPLAGVRSVRSAAGEFVPSGEPRGAPSPGERAAAMTADGTTVANTVAGTIDDPPALAPVVLLPMAGMAVVLLGLAVLFMQAGTWNVQVFVAAQGLTRALPDGFWSWVTICGNGVVAFALIAPTLAWQPRWYAAGLTAAVLAGAYSNGVKRLFALPRPASILEADHLHVIGETLRANAFPSGHAVTAFTLASVLVLASRRPGMTAAWAVPGAMLIALSRIAVGAHWPADIAAGAAGGWICGALGVAIVMRWRAWNTSSGVRTMAVISIGVGVSLFVVDLGYPLAVPLQDLSGVVAIVAGGVALVRPRRDALLPTSSTASARDPS